MSGGAAVKGIARTAAVAIGLFGVSGYGAARLLLPERLRADLWVLVLPVGAACSMLALTVLGLLHIPLSISVWLVIGAGAVLAAYAVRRGPALPAGQLAPVRIGVPLALAALVAAIMLLPSFRAGFPTVPGQNGDAVLAVGTADFLQHAPPTAVRPELGLDSVPVLWRSKLPIYYGLAGVSELSGQYPAVTFATVAAMGMAMAALGFYLLVVQGLGAPFAAGLLALFLVPLTRILVYVDIHPYFNQTWAVFALPFTFLFGWLALREPGPRTAAPAVLFTALALFTYPLLLPFPALFLGVIAWRRRHEVDWRRLPRVRRKWVWAVLAVPAVPVLAVLGRGIVEKVVPAIDALRPGGDMSGWSGPDLPFLPYGWFVGVNGADWLVALGVGAVVVLAAVALASVRRTEVGFALGVVVVAALLAGLYLRAHDDAQLFWFKTLSFTGPLVVMLAIVALVTRVPRWAGVAGLVVLALVLADGARREVDTTYDQYTAGLHDLATWDEKIPANETIRIDVPQSGWQMWTWLLLPDHRVSVSAPLEGIYPHPPVGFDADLSLVQSWQKRPVDAVGPPVLRNDEYVLYRLRRGVPGRGPDRSSQTLEGGVRHITY